MTLLNYCWESRLMQPLWKSIQRLLENLGLALLLCCIFLKELKASCHCDTCTPILRVAHFIITNSWKQTQMPINWLMNKDVGSFFHTVVCYWVTKDKLENFLDKWIYFKNTLLKWNKSNTNDTITISFLYEKLKV